MSAAPAGADERPLALVVLGCRLPPPRVADRGAMARRAARAAEAFREGRAPLVVACGGRRWHGVCEATFLRDALVARGVPEARILRECRSLTTVENARCAAELLAEHGVRRVGVVTCDWHVARALACFHAAGLEPYGLAAPSPPLPRWRRVRRALGERIRSVLWRSW